MTIASDTQDHEPTAATATPLAATLPDDVTLAPATGTGEPAAPVVVNETPEQAAKRLAGEIATATGWTVKAAAMSMVATKDGFGPITVHCSTVEEAAELLLAKLTDPDFEPLVRTELPPAAENEDVDLVELAAG